MKKETISKIKHHPEWVEFQKWAIQKIQELDTTSGLSELTNEQAGEEGKIRQRTLAKITEIFSPFFDYRKQKEITTEQVQKKKDEYGL